MEKYFVEMCVGSIEQAIAAESGGASRVELCDNILDGGTTPSYGTIKTCREKLSIKMHVIIRPRGADFLYSDTEFAVMKEDVTMAKELGADGIAFSILDKNGEIDKERSAKIIKLARPMSVTFIRGFDVARDPFRALEDLIDIQADRLLTSGQQPHITDGAELIHQLIQKAEDRIIIMPGGVSEINIDKVAEITSASEFHSYLTEYVNGNMKYREKNIPMGACLPAPPEYKLRVLSSDKVESMVLKHK